jgi:hypothetical protein
LPKQKIPLKSKIEIRKDLLNGIAAAKKRLAYVQALGAPEPTFHIRDGEAYANSDTPPLTFYELTSASTLPVATAIRVEVPPLDPEKARHTPENGFIVDEVHASTVQPNGHKDKIVFRFFIHDSEANLTATVSKIEECSKNFHKESSCGWIRSKSKTASCTLDCRRIRCTAETDSR